MGCDIHCYVEFQRENAGQWWRSFGGRINPGRNYDVFERLAGVRGPNALFPRRGMPDDAGFYSSDDNWLWITYKGQPWDGSVDWATAERYIRNGCPTKGEVKPSVISHRSDGGAVVVSDNTEHVGKPQYVAAPDWHSHSWVTPDEWEQAITFESVYPAGVEYRAMLAAMRVLEADGHRVRVVFWFDN